MDGTAPEILITWPDYDAEGEKLGGALRAAGYRLKLAAKHGPRSSGEVLALARDAAGAIVSTDPFGPEVFSACERLRVIARVGIGVDSIDLGSATEHGVIVTVTPGANENAVAEHTVALMLAASRRVVEHDSAIRDGAWNRTGSATPWELAGCRVGLVGYGQIGRLVSRRLAGFDVEILFSDPAQREGVPNATPLPLAELLRRSDVVSIHAPLLETTRQLIGHTELALMQPQAILVNTARGGVVDERALVEALAGGRLRAAALDVFVDEPPRSQQLLALPNVVLSPHIAGLSERSVSEMTRRATTSVLDVLAGRVPADVANPEVLDHPAVSATHMGAGLA